MRETNYEKSVGGVLIHEGKVLLARHTYGSGNGKLIIPGGYIERNEAPEDAIVREYLEETGVTVRPCALLGVRFNMHDWYAVFRLNYVSGTPRSDGDENSEVVWMDTAEALARDDVPALTKMLIESALRGTALPLNEAYTSEKWAPYSFYACE